MRSLVIIIALISISAVNPLRAQDPEVTRIKALMDAQLKAWNAGNLEGFMDTYWKSDSLLFIGKKGLTYGWQATLDNYRKSYPGKEGMGTLAFNLLEFKKLPGDTYFVVGQWSLTRTISNLSGHFSILLRKISGEWKIVADHSS
ncbi:YybH family protein [Chitinophaga sp. 22620]|uniref:YybH family protein n=1 Tax=Chitinophaga sp. 22620 TaxID=3453952 RepID=UPI003F830E2E